MAGALDESAFADGFFRARAVGPRNFDLYVLAEPGLEDVELLLPRDIAAPEAVRKLAAAIDTLSQLEGKDRTQVIADVRAIGFDVVKSRIPDDLVHEDTIYLEQAVSYTADMKKFLASGATTELRPNLYFMRAKKEASQYADRCRFGHTFKGSFGFTIESPVTPNLEPALPGMEGAQVPPFERRVIQRIARGMGVIQEAVRSDDPTVAVNGHETGFSANMCDDFATLVQETAPVGMAFGFAFSPEWPAVPVGELMVGPQHIEMARVVARTMRERPISVIEEIFGRVIRLQNEADPTDLLDETNEREVVVHWESEDYGDLNVKVSLTPNEYLMAADAHRHGQPVHVRGRLERQGRRWVLLEPTDFRL